MITTTDNSIHISYLKTNPEPNDFQMGTFSIFKDNYPLLFEFLKDKQALQEFIDLITEFEKQKDGGRNNNSFTRQKDGNPENITK